MTLSIVRCRPRPGRRHCLTLIDPVVRVRVWVKVRVRVAVRYGVRVRVRVRVSVRVSVTTGA